MRQLGPEGPSNDHLMEQFLFQLKEGPLTQVLKRHVQQQQPEESLDKVQQEGL